MRVLQIGCGKMGQFICNVLKETELINELVVYDLRYEKDFEEDGVQYVGTLDESEVSKFDCAIITTPATTHCKIMKMLIHGGMKNIYVEKPAVMNTQEFDEINAIKKDCNIVVGYILRQSEPMFALKLIIAKMLYEGYQMELCSVTYQKYLPSIAEERAKNDIGVFEEVVHIWDLLFNYLEFKTAKCDLLDKTLEKDSDREDRIIYAQLSYYLKFTHSNVLLQLTSSFKAEEKKRDFYFTFKDANGNRQHIYLSFDNEDGYDWLVVTLANGDIVYKEEYPSLEKLRHQMEEVLHYFKSGEEYNLSMFEDSMAVIDLLQAAGIYS